MKALIVTTQRHYNFGTILQCHALQHYVESRGYYVEVLDYICSEYRRSVASRLRIFLGDFRRHPLKYLKIFFNSERWCRREYLFDKFLRKRINLTPVQYSSFESIKDTLPIYDIYIAGSDQIWNPRLGGFKPAYFLKFAPSQSLKISYAASFGIDSFNTEESREIGNMVEDLKSISCREQSGVDFLRKAGIESSLVVDPVLLHPASYWRSIYDNRLSKKMPNKFVLSYFLSRSEVKSDLVKSVCNETDLSCLDLCADKDASSDSVLAAGPEQFLGLIDNCELLITDSFHGMVFAIIFHKNFYIIPRKTDDSNSQDTRILNLLDKLNLMDRWLPSMSVPEKIELLDYAKVEPLKTQYVAISSHWLDSKLERAKQFDEKDSIS